MATVFATVRETPAVDLVTALPNGDATDIGNIKWIIQPTAEGGQASMNPCVGIFAGTTWTVAHWIDLPVYSILFCPLLGTPAVYMKTVGGATNTWKSQAINT